MEKIKLWSDWDVAEQKICTCYPSCWLLVAGLLAGGICNVIVAIITAVLTSPSLKCSLS